MWCYLFFKNVIPEIGQVLISKSKVAYAVFVFYLFIYNSTTYKKIQYTTYNTILYTTFSFFRHTERKRKVDYLRRIVQGTTYKMYFLYAATQLTKHLKNANYRSEGTPLVFLKRLKVIGGDG